MMSKTETKRERRRCTSWGPQDSRSDTEGSLLVFFFASCFLNLELNKSVTQKPDRHRQKEPRQNPALSDQRNRKRAAYQVRTLEDNNHCPLAKQEGKNRGPAHTSTGREGILDFQPGQAPPRHPKPPAPSPTQRCVREGGLRLLVSPSVLWLMTT